MSNEEAIKDFLAWMNKKKISCVASRTAPKNDSGNCCIGVWNYVWFNPCAMINNTKIYCSSDCCTQDGACEHCKKPIVVDRTFADTIKVTLPDGYTQKFWVDITDLEAIKRVYLMKEKGII